MRMRFELIMLYFFLKIRWAYFHLHPNYIKFYMAPDEAHFQHVHSGTIYSNYIIRRFDE